jgi:hypothetical protein
MSSSTPKQFRTTSIAFWASLTILVAAAFLYVFLYQATRSVGSSNALLQAETTVLEGEQSEVGSLKRDLAANQARQPVLVSYFIDAADIVPFLETVEGYGRTTNVAVKFDTVDIKRAPDQLAVTLTGEGSFTNLYRFIALVEAAPYELTFTNASVEKSGTSGEWQARLSLAVTSITGVANVPAAPKAK